MKRSPVAVVAGASTGILGAGTVVLSIVEAANKAAAILGIQMGAVALCIIWCAAAFAWWQGQRDARRTAERVEAEQRRSEEYERGRREIRDIYQAAADRGERVFDRTIEVMQDAIVELKNGQAATNKLVAELAAEVRAFAPPRRAGALG